MAEEPVVNPIDRRFVEALKSAFQRLNESHGPLYAALVARLEDRPTDDWVVLAGSARLAKRRLAGIQAIINVMRRALPKAYWAQIRRVDVLPTDDPVYLSLSRGMTVKLGADVTIKACRVFGVEISLAIVFALSRATRSARKPRHSTQRTNRVRPARSK